MHVKFMHHHQGALSPQFAVFEIKVTGTIVRIGRYLVFWYLASTKQKKPQGVGVLDRGTL